MVLKTGFQLLYTIAPYDFVIKYNLDILLRFTHLFTYFHDNIKESDKVK